MGVRGQRAAPDGETSRAARRAGVPAPPRGQWRYVTVATSSGSVCSLLIAWGMVFEPLARRRRKGRSGPLFCMKEWSEQFNIHY